MTQIFLTLSNLGYYLATLFPKIASWFSKYTKWLNLDNSLRLFKFLSMKSVVFFAYGLAITALTTVITTLVMLYNEINNLIDFINYLSIGGGSSVGTFSFSCFFHFLKIIGITDAITSSLPFLFSAFSFLFLRLFYLNLLKSLHFFTAMTNNLLSYK
jgi:hypothetical protein